jgi:hypothetical protein
MQHVTAFSSPQTVPAVPAASRKPTLWILDSWRDLVLYLSLVWIYNRKRVETDSSIGGFMRFVFRRSGSLVGLYVA